MYIDELFARMKKNWSLIQTISKCSLCIGMKIECSKQEQKEYLNRHEWVGR